MSFAWCAPFLFSLLRLLFSFFSLAISGEDQKGAGAGATSYWSAGVIVNFLFAFYLGFESITFEFMLAPLTASHFYWSPTVLSLYMFIAGCSVLPGILTVKVSCAVHSRIERLVWWHFGVL
jgi:hypothetical protein